jgi:hypothetical protein
MHHNNRQPHNHGRKTPAGPDQIPSTDATPRPQAARTRGWLHLSDNHPQALHKGLTRSRHCGTCHGTTNSALARKPSLARVIYNATVHAVGKCFMQLCNLIPPTLKQPCCAFRTYTYYCMHDMHSMLYTCVDLTAYTMNCHENHINSTTPTHVCS